jgi:hypothetical protein
MMYWSIHGGVYFVEGSPEKHLPLSPISTELNDFFAQNQLRTLDDLKDRMASHAQSLGGNAVISFKYGQRSSVWKSLFGMDNVLWYGSGEVARIDPALLPKRD